MSHFTLGGKVYRTNPLNKFSDGQFVRVVQKTHNGDVEIIRGKILFTPREDYNYYTILIDKPYDFRFPFFVAREAEISEISNQEVLAGE